MKLHGPKPPSIMSKPRLSMKQRYLLADLEEAGAGASVECGPADKATARSLERRGYLSILPGESPLGHFEVKLSVKVGDAPGMTSTN